MNQDFMGNVAVRVSVIGVLAILALFLLAETVDTVQSYGHIQGVQPSTITVQGTGKASAVPNIANISYSVTESAAKVADAQTAATKKSNAALDFLKKQGIEDKDVQAASYSVYPQYSNAEPCRTGVLCPNSGTPKIVGYQVSQTVTVKVRDTAKVGDILQGLGSLEVQNISGPNFAIDDDSRVTADARGKAIADARSKAQVLAGQLGVHLGKVVNFSENGGSPYPVMQTYGKAAGVMDSAVAAPSLPVGQNETDVNVSITYEIR